MYVIALYNPRIDDLPDVYEEEGKVKYFKSDIEAEYFLHSLYIRNNIYITPLLDDHMILMSVQ
tara:strand:- start:67 stop:255 length:189 start_codon:yes stop_codon:yes gene_type:complete